MRRQMAPAPPAAAATHQVRYPENRGAEYFFYSSLSATTNQPLSRVGFMHGSLVQHLAHAFSGLHATPNERSGERKGQSKPCVGLRHAR